MSVARGALNDLSRYTVMNKKRKCARDEVLHLMNKKTRVKSTQQKPEWKHRFVCLAYHQHYQAPSSEDEKDKLHMAGLGEKVIEFPVLNVDAESFRETIHSQSCAFQVATSCARQNLIQRSWNHCQT